MFGKKREQLRQWSLLGELLKTVRLLEALDFMASAFGKKHVDWALIRIQAAAGRGLLEIADDLANDAPMEVLDALEAGEGDGRLPERLFDLVPHPEAFASVFTQDEGAAPIVTQALREAIEQGASGILLSALPAGGGEWKILLGDFWTPRTTHSAAEFSAMVRRVWIMAGQSYWAPKAGVFRLRVHGATIEMRVTPDPKGGLGIEILSTTKD